MIPDAAILPGGDAAVEPGDGDIVAGDILPHETDRGAGREGITDPGQETEGFTGEAGEDQMADERAAEHDAVRIIPRGAGLAAHLSDGRGGFLKIIRGAGAEAGGAGGEMLEIRKVDVDDPVEEAEGIDGFIAGGVPDEGERRTPEGEGFEDPRDEGGGGDEGNRMHAEVREALQGVGELPGREGAALVAVGNIAVLAIDAAEGAAGEEDRAGAAGPGDGRLLPEVGSDPGDEHFIGEAAETGGRGAVRAALAGA